LNFLNLDIQEVSQNKLELFSVYWFFSKASC